MHRMHYLLHRFGLQSNIICSARYHKDDGSNKITRPAVYAALNSILALYPELAIVGVLEKSPKPGKHRLRRALLHRINLSACTEFIDTPEDEITPKLLEKLHGEWLWTADKPDKPWWKVVVVNHQHVVFVFHHFVCDGRFGYAFHHAFATALDGIHEPSTTPSVVEIDVAQAPVATMYEELYDYQGSIWRAICTMLYICFIRLVYGRRLFFPDVPKVAFVQRPIDAVAAPAQRVVTRVATCRIHANEVKAILAACRVHNTTFTPLMVVLINLVLATEHYPASKRGLSFCAVDLRPILLAPPRTHRKAARDIMNGSTSIMQVHQLDSIRRAGSPAAASASAATSTSLPSRNLVDADAIWEPVQEYGTRLREFREGPLPAAVKTALECKIIGEDVEDMLQRGMPALGLLMTNGFLVSNLGPFSSAPGWGCWRVTDIQFSSAATHRSSGVSGIVFSVAGVKDGDTIINASYEDGALTQESVEALLRSVVAKMEYLGTTFEATKKTA